MLAHLREAIVSDRYALGSHPFEWQPTEDLGVPKTPVRESLVILGSEGLVTIAPQTRGLRLHPEAREVAAICDFRQAIEGSALWLAFERHRSALADDISGIVEWMARARAPRDRRAHLLLDTTFHEAFLRH